mmetsp:Transcript_64050/g.134648  ORF Transcript_64050/g.134648 Transcript_64050/m.134648 type:complete len:236 (+) Transcript_64050:470-1177(+)
MGTEVATVLEERRRYPLAFFALVPASCDELGLYELVEALSHQQIHVPVGAEAVAWVDGLPWCVVHKSTDAHMSCRLLWLFLSEEVLLPNILTSSAKLQNSRRHASAGGAGSEDDALRLRPCEDPLVSSAAIYVGVVDGELGANPVVYQESVATELACVLFDEALGVRRGAPEEGAPEEPNEHGRGLHGWWSSAQPNPSHAPLGHVNLLFDERGRSRVRKAQGCQTHTHSWHRDRY